jgi:DNA-binding NtrC family response regulator
VRDVRLLVADDDAEMRSWLRQVLEPHGASVAEADSGVDLLRLLNEEGPFDLVVSDVRMSWASGIQVLAMVRSAGYETPFIVITAYADERVRCAASQLRAVLIEKPFEIERLVEAADQILPAHLGGKVAVPEDLEVPGRSEGAWRGS